MLNNLRLRIQANDILSAIKSTIANKTLTLKTCWVENKLYTVHLQCTFRGKTLNSWGCDRKELIALSKAIMELAERIHMSEPVFIWKNGSSTTDHAELLIQEPSLPHFLSTTSGLAAHLDRKECERCATNELIERHTISKALLEGISPNERPTSNTYIWDGPLGRTVALISYKLGTGYIYGSAASTSKKNAIIKAGEELSAPIAWSRNMANLTAFIANQPQTYAQQIRKHHIQEMEAPQILKKIHHESTKISNGITSKDLWHGEVSLFPKFKSIKNFVVLRAFSPLMQPLHFDNLKNGYINPKAISLQSLNVQCDYNVVA